jgi:hypothetical protein
MQPDTARRRLARRGWTRRDLVSLAVLAPAALGAATAPLEARGAEPADSAPAGAAPGGAVRIAERQHPDDVVTLDASDERLVVRVRSARGIGRCTLAAPGGRWPVAVTILLEGFAELEDFEVSSGGLRTQGGRRESGRLPRFATPVDDTVAAAQAAATPVGMLDVRIEKTAAGVVVTLPPGLLRDGGAERATIRWVDWLRR